MIVSRLSIATEDTKEIYQLGIEFCQAWLASVVEDQDGVDHLDAGGVVWRC